MTITIDGTTGIASVDGSAGSPSVRGADANSGIFYSSDAIKFSTGGTERLAMTTTAYPRILQVVTYASTTSTLINSASMEDSGLSGSITPSSSSSKILILIHQPFYVWKDDVSGSLKPRGAWRVLRDSTSILSTANAWSWGPNITGNITGATGMDIRGIISINYLDSPSTTSAITYKTQGRPESTGDNGHIYFQVDSNPASMQLLEVAG